MQGSILYVLWQKTLILTIISRFASKSNITNHAFLIDTDEQFIADDVSDEHKNGLLLAKACDSGNIELVDFFLKNKVDVNQKFGGVHDDDGSKLIGMTPIFSAVEGGGHPEIVKKLIDAGANVNVKVGVRASTQEGMFLNFSSKLVNLTVLDVAIRKGNEEVIQILKSAGAKTTWTGRRALK